MPTRWPITPRDLLRFQMVSDPQVSPDGRSVGWVRTWIDAEANRYHSALMITDVANGRSRQLEAPGDLCTRPRWSPDGRFLAYLSADRLDGGVPHHGGAPPSHAVSQLRVIRPDGRAAWTLTSLKHGAQEPVWSPDGTRLACTTRVDPRRGLELTGDGTDDDPYARYNRDVQVVRRLRWKLDGVGFFGDTWSQIVFMSFDPDRASGAPPPAADLRTMGEFDHTGPMWSPDGSRLAATGNLQYDADGSRRAYVYLIDVAGSHPAQPVELFGLQEMRSRDLSWSHDGDLLAVCGHDVPRIGHYGNQRLWIVSTRDGSARCVTSHLDLTFGDYSRNMDMRGYGGDDRPRWLPGGGGLLILANERGGVHLCEFSLESGQLTRLTSGNQVVSAFSVDRACQMIVMLIEHDLDPGNLYVIERESGPAPRGSVGARQRLTGVNDDLLAEVELSVPERFPFASGGMTVDGWIVPPLRREPGVKYPAILYTGGGPGGMRACVFVHEFQVYAANGYAVVHCNARGNQGYGEAFSTATRGHWGDLDYEDNLACIRTACERFPYLDRDRLAVAGGSYGGYMVLWIVSHTQEFKAAVADRSLFNRYSMTGTSDIGFLLDTVEFDARRPWEARQAYLERSPFHYVADIRAPTLVVHSDADLRCPVEQGEQLFTALKRLGVATEFVRFPGESHDLSRSGGPWHRVFRLDRYLDWFRRWL